MTNLALPMLFVRGYCKMLNQKNKRHPESRDETLTSGVFFLNFRQIFQSNHLSNPSLSSSFMANSLDGYGFLLMKRFTVST